MRSGRTRRIIWNLNPPLLYNFSAGVGYRFYITNSFYLGVRAKYNFVDYSLNNVIDFTGNPVTVQFIIGTVNNVLRNDNLRALKYRLRR